MVCYDSDAVTSSTETYESYSSLSIVVTYQSAVFRGSYNPTNKTRAEVIQNLIRYSRYIYHDGRIRTKSHILQRQRLISYEYRL